MAIYVYASPILPGKTDFVRQTYRLKQLQYMPEQSQEQREFRRFIGLQGWQAWIYQLRGKDYFLHGLRTESFSGAINGLQQLIAEGHPIANWIRNFYLAAFGKDYRQAYAAPNIERLISLETAVPIGERVENSSFIWPLAKGQLAAHREFSRQVQGEYRRRLQEFFAPLGITKIVTYLQYSAGREMVTVYVEKLASANPPEKGREKSSPAVRWVVDQLSAHTGLAPDALVGEAELLTPTLGLLEGENQHSHALSAKFP